MRKGFNKFSKEPLLGLMNPFRGLFRHKGGGDKKAINNYLRLSVFGRRQG